MMLVTPFAQSRPQRRLASAGLLMAGLLLASAACAVPCREPQLESVSSTDTLCRFYKGTRHYRGKDYAAAGREWQAIVDTQASLKDHPELRASAQSNLGYLYFMGLGVKKDRERAIHAYWLPAYKAGHDEGYHLCHAYADDRPKWALGYCREALRRYAEAGAEVSGDKVIIDQLKNFIRQLESR